MNKKMRLFLFCILVLIIVSLSVLFGATSYYSKDINMQLNREDMINGLSTESMIGKKYKVVIDPGHGGEDVGATSASGQYEKDFTLSVSKKVESLLEQESGIKVYMTRSDDTFLSQESRYRPKFANEINADLFLSIHGNTYSDASVSGTETYYYHRNSRHFAESIQKHVVDATGFRDRGVKKQDLFVVKDTKMPAALVEVGYITNPKDESKLWNDDFQTDVAIAIVEGIKEYMDAKLGY